MRATAMLLKQKHDKAIYISMKLYSTAP